MIFFGSLIDKENSNFEEMSEASKNTIIDSYGSLEEFKTEVRKLG